jgi:hypothetical protein
MATDWNPWRLVCKGLLATIRGLRAFRARLGLVTGPDEPFGSLAFQLLTQARPREALSRIERRMLEDSNPRILAMWCVSAAFICEDLGERAKAAVYWERASVLNPEWASQCGDKLTARVSRLREAL